MGDSTKQERRRRSGERSASHAAWTRLAQYRHWILGAGLVLVLVAVVGAWRQFRADSSESIDDAFAELDGFDAPSSPTLGEPSAPVALTAPAPLTPPPLDFGQALSLPPAIGHRQESPISSAHFTAPAASSPATPPVWLPGTIEDIDDEPAAPVFALPEAALRYTRPPQ